jgi:histidinol dehydrogenase
MLTIYDPETARQRLLKRRDPGEQTLPPAMEERMQRLFGDPAQPYKKIIPQDAVLRILNEIKHEGDNALRHWTTALDGSAPAAFRVSTSEMTQALDELPVEQRRALELASQRVRAFYQRQPLTSWITQELGGTLGQLIRPIQRVGLYAPAGTAPLPSTVLMSAIPAQVAGVKEIVLVSPPQRATGRIAPIILATAALIGLEEVYTMGGAQAIGALAYGTQSIPPVDKIFGPGNLFVTLAKRQVYGVVGIDSLAGPTETVIIAEEGARPEWIAADMLAQAEHDPLASAILLTPSRPLAEAVQMEVAHQIEALSRAEIIAASFHGQGGIVLTRDLEEAVDLANRYAPEHLCLSVADPWRWTEKITSAGGIFLGEHSFEVLGDYVAGPSHVMPTGGSARFGSPLNVWDFVKIISLIGLDPLTASQIAPAAVAIASAEGLDGHAQAVRKRL